MRRMIATVLGFCLLLGTASKAPALVQCVGDCDGDGRVRVDELLTAVRIVLGAQPLDACAGLDQQTGKVGVPDVVLAITNALGGCLFSHVDYVIVGSYNGVNGAAGVLFLDLVRTEVALAHWTVSLSYSPHGFGGPGTISGYGTADLVRADERLLFDLQAQIGTSEPFALTGSALWRPPSLNSDVLRDPYFRSNVHLSADAIELDFIGINPVVE
jgi:hypothetical protein